MSLHWIGIWLLVLSPAGATEKYPRADLLIEAADLAKPETAKQYRILDTRGKSSYGEGHIPNALWVDATTWARTAKNLQDLAAWEKLIGGLGIDPDTRVVVYGDGLSSTARVWWLLRYWGIRDVRLLNGGWKAWQQAGGRVSREIPEVPKKTVKLTPHPERLALKDQLIHSLKDHSLQIIDTRSTGEYCGQTKTAERNGAIPGAIHREWSDLVNPQTGRFKSPAELARLLRDSGIDARRPTVTYCQSGGRAAVMAFALELMGLKDVRNYYRSWSEWGNAPDTPIVKPPEKK